MNKAYCLVWNRAKEIWVVVAETVRGKGGIPSVTIAAVASLLLSAASTHALPTSPQIINGTAAISTSGNAMTVTNSANAIINWQSFSISQNESTRFVQPTAASAVLNRVTGGDPSKILGTLQSNGKVLLINQNGILFGSSARVDVNGLIASTLDITNQDFLAGKMNFTAGSIAGSVENQGTITTPGGGQVYLIAPDVTNSGIITSPNGEILLAAGKEVLIVDKTNPEIAMVVSAPENQSLNLGSLVADAGRIGVYGGIVRQKGRVSADSAVSEGGKIFFKATKSIELAENSITTADGEDGGQIIAKTEEDGKISGTLTARGIISAQGDGANGSGGFVETSAAKLDLKGVNVKTNGGNWLLDPYNFTIGTDISGANLSTALASNDVTIQTTNTGATCTNATCGAGTSSGNGDINVNDSVSWSSAKTLTLNAWRNININSSITSSNASGKLSLLYGQGALASGNTSRYSVSAPVNLSTGNNFNTKLGSDGSPVIFTVINL